MSSEETADNRTVSHFMYIFTSCKLNLSILPKVPVVAVRADNDLLWAIFVDMPLEKSFLKFGSAFISAQHVHELTSILVFLRTEKSFT